MTCHACRRYHDNICWPMKDALWTIVKSKGSARQQGAGMGTRRAGARGLMERPS